MESELDSDLILVKTHQLKAALTNNKWALKEFIDGNTGILTPLQKEALMKIFNSNERAIKLIEHIFNTDKGISHAIKPEKTNIDIHKLLLEVVDNAHIEMERKDIKIHLDVLESALPDMSCDEESIKYVLGNVLDNAIHYSRLNGEIFIKVSREGNSAVIEIRDTGIGIPTSEQGHIFEKFFRASNASQTDSDGTGFGLFTSKHIVEKYGGKIEFESQEHSGSTFWISLPFNKAI